MLHSAFCRKLAATMSMVGALSACSISPSLVDRKDVIELAPTEQAPLVTPSKSASTMREALACMDRMLATEQVPTTLVAVKTIPDPSGLFLTDTKAMVITALSRMSRTSQAFKVVDYEIDALKQNTVQTLTNLLLNSGQIELRKPQIYVSGAISFGDKTVVAKKSSLGVSTKNTDASYSWDVLGTMVGLDLHLGEMNTRTLFPGVDSANELVVASGGRAIELGGRATGLPRHIYSLGVQFDRSADNNQGAGAGIRLLVDLATIELVGKWAKIPYWDCVEYEQNHPEFKRQLRTWYDDLTATERLALAQRVLKAQGLWENEMDGQDSPQLRKVLSSYQSAMDLTPVGRVTYETYASLMSSYVGMSAEDKLTPPSVQDAGQLTPYPSGLPENEPDPRAVNLTMLGHKEPVIGVGDDIVLRIASARSAYLYCYYKDAAGTVSQIYPNPQQLAPRVQGKSAVLVPDVNQANSFLIQAAVPGTEQAYCATTQAPLKDHVPAAFTQAKLEPLKDVTSLEEVQKSLDATGLVLGSQTLQWDVQGPGTVAATGAVK